MAVLFDKLFIQAADMSSYKDISDHMDESDMKNYIREAQVADLTPFLGPELYLLMQNDFTAPDVWATQKYDDLFNGVDYNSGGKTIRQHGIQPMLTLFTYARVLDNVQLSLARVGPVTYLSEDTSDPTTQAQIKTKIISTRAMAIRYQEEVEQYLRDLSSTYPEWVDRAAKNKTYQFHKIM